jgi:hypothetical protein
MFFPIQHQISLSVAMIPRTQVVKVRPFMKGFDYGELTLGIGVRGLRIAISISTASSGSNHIIVASAPRSIPECILRVRNSNDSLQKPTSSSLAEHL